MFGPTSSHSGLFKWLLQRLCNPVKQAANCKVDVCLFYSDKSNWALQHLFTFKVLQDHETWHHSQFVCWRGESRCERVGATFPLKDWHNSRTPPHWCKPRAAINKQNLSLSCEWQDPGINGIIFQPTKCALWCVFHHVCTHCSCSEMYFRGEDVKKPAEPLMRKLCSSLKIG